MGNRKAPSFIEDWRRDLLADTSFYRAVWVSVGQVGGKLETWVTVSGLIMIAAASILVGIFMPELYARTTEMYEVTTRVTAYTFTYCTSVMAFILAAYAITVTLLTEKASSELAQIIIGRRKISQFKILHFSFIFAFAVLFVGSFLSCFLYVLYMKNGILSRFSGAEWIWLKLITFNANALLLAIIVYSILLIKTVFWSVYQVIVTSLTIAAEDQD